MKWTPEKIAEMRAMAATGCSKAEAVARSGATISAIRKIADRFGFKFVKHSQAELAVFAEVSKAKTLAREARKEAKKRAARIEARKGEMFVVRPGGRAASKLSLAQLRQMYAANRGLTKNQMRDDLRKAVVNTAAMQAEQVRP